MGKTFQYQVGLPRLPIPDLSDTLENFLEWVNPLLSEEQFEKSNGIVNRFGKEEGPILQNALKHYIQENHLKNWATPLWKDIYLKPRVPLIVEGNVFYVLENKEGLTYKQRDLAARVIISALEFKSLIDTERLGVDKHKNTPLCMEQYKNFFASTRIPGRVQDEFKKSPASKHILILSQGYAFIMDVYQASGKIKSQWEIQQSLEIILEEEGIGQGIGILTSLERNAWAENRMQILKLDRFNREHLKKIESAIFAVCLDQESPQNLEEISRSMLYGKGANRWFDKSIQFVITNNSVIGINMEHTGMDGSTMSTLVQYLYDHIDRAESIKTNNEIVKPEKLEFILNDTIKENIMIAKEKFNEISLNNEIRVFVFKDFGIDRIKKFGLSPDAFVQIAIQWAQYKLFGRFYSQYEAVMTRKFLSGRIDVMYSVTNEAFDFIESMGKERYNKDHRRILLKKAAEKHIERVRKCQNGKGIDGHLMGLLEMYKRFGKELGMAVVPEIFQDDAYKTLTHSTICTSTTSPYGLMLAGWGPVVEDGFAIRYIKYTNKITFHTVSRKYKEEDLDQLLEYIKDSLRKMADLMRD